MKPEMMLRQTAANLLSLLNDQGKAETVLVELKDLQHILNLIPDWRQILLAQRVSSDLKLKINQALLSGVCREETLALFNLLTEKRLTGFIEKFIREYEKQYRLRMNVKMVKIQKNPSLESTELSRFKAVVEKLLPGHLQWSEVSDETIIGGILLQVDNQVYDATVNHQLDVMRRLLESN